MGTHIPVILSWSWSQINASSAPKHIHTLLQTSTTAYSRNMSFLSGFLGNKAADSFVDKAVDQAAAAAKRKVKEKMTGQKQENDKTGAWEVFSQVKRIRTRNQRKRQEVEYLVASFQPKKPEGNSTGGAVSAGGGNAESNSGVDSSFNDALDDLANEFGDK